MAAPAIVAPGRTVHHDGAYRGPGAELKGLDAGDVKRLTGLGFLVDPAARAPDPDLEAGAKVITTEGPVVKAEGSRKAAAGEA